MVETYERLDADRIICIRKADKECQKLKMGGVPWSLGLQRVRYALGIWQLLMKKTVGRKVSSNLIKWKAKAAGLQHIFICEMSYEVAVQEERIALKTYMKLKAGSVKARETFLEDLAEAQSQAGNLSKASILRQLKNRERSKRSNR